MAFVPQPAGDARAAVDAPSYADAPGHAEALAYAEDLRASEAEGLLGPLDRTKEERKQRLARVLEKLDPRLRRVELDFRRVAQQEGLSLAEAREKHRAIELCGPLSGRGVQVVLSDDAVWITLPAYVNGTGPDALCANAWRYLLALAAAGLWTYDPQLGRLLDLASDFAEVQERYRASVQRAPTQTAARRRPWWRFW